MHKFPTKEFLRERCIERLDDDISLSQIEKDLESMRTDSRLGFNAPIRYNRLNKGYYYEDEDYEFMNLPVSYDDVESLDMISALLQQLGSVELVRKFESILQKLMEYRNISRLGDAKEINKIIFLEQAVFDDGIQWLEPLTKAILNKVVIEFEYQKFLSDTIKVHEVEPLLLKEFRNRWYLLGLHCKTKSLLLFGLERLTNLKLIEGKHFKRPGGFDHVDYFKHYYGITIKDGKPEKIVLSFTPRQGMYIKTQPLHESQRILKDDKNELRIELYLVPNFDLFMQILSYGAEAKVLKPEGLVKWVKEEVEKTALIYKTQ